MNTELLEKPLLKPMKVVFANGKTCPHCGVPMLTLWGRKEGRKLYRCCSCFRATVVPIPVDTGRKRRFGYLVSRCGGMLETDAVPPELKGLRRNRVKIISQRELKEKVPLA